jgi:hypothetical protein
MLPKEFILFKNFLNLHGPGSLQVVQVDRRVTGEEL